MNSRFTRTFAFVSVAALAALAGCANKGACCDTKEAPAKSDAPAKSSAAPATPTGNMVVINTLCPIGNDEFGSKDHPAELSRTWNGKNIGFCCDHCVAKFDKMTPEKKNEVAVAAAANKAL